MWDAFVRRTSTSRARLHVLMTLEAGGCCDNELPLAPLQHALARVPPDTGVFLHLIVSRGAVAPIAPGNSNQAAGVTAGGSEADPGSSTAAVASTTAQRLDVLLADVVAAGGPCARVASVMGRRQAMPPGGDYDRLHGVLQTLLGTAPSVAVPAWTLAERASVAAVLAHWPHHQLDELVPLSLDAEGCMRGSDSLFIYSTEPIGLGELHSCLTNAEVKLLQEGVACTSTSKRGMKASSTRASYPFRF